MGRFAALPKGGEAMSVYQAISLVIAGSALLFKVLEYIDNKK